MVERDFADICIHPKPVGHRPEDWGCICQWNSKQSWYQLIYCKRQKLWRWKVSRFAGFIKYVGKNFVIFSITTLFSIIHSWFSNSTKQLQAFQQKFCIPTWILLKTVISIPGNGRLYITDTCVQISRFLGWSCSRRRRKATVEVSLKWNLRSLTASSLASSASYFLIAWQKRYRFFATTVEYYLKIFHDVNFQRSKSLAGKTFAVY